MTIDSFLADLYRQDVKLWLDGSRLRCNAPEEVLTADLNAELQKRKTEIIAFLQQTPTAIAPSIQPALRPDHLPLSFAQQRLWFFEQLQPDTAIYNIPIALRLTGSLNVAAFEQALRALIDRHEILRTNFAIAEGNPVQVIRDRTSLPLAIESLESLTTKEQEAAIEQFTATAAQTPFNLEQDSLLRGVLLRQSAIDHVLLLTMHHIIADGWSMEVVVNP